MNADCFLVLRAIVIKYCMKEREKWSFGGYGYAWSFIGWNHYLNKFTFPRNIFHTAVIFM
jgi:hypothetical protein